jgi:hypothetical protein
VKGRITAYNTNTSQGEIQGHDGSLYRFERQEWWEDGIPTLEAAIDFEPQASQARKICFDDRATAIIRQYPGPIELHSSLSIRAGNALVSVVCVLIALVMYIVRNAVWADPTSYGAAIPNLAIIALGLLALVMARSAVALKPPLRLDRDGILHRNGFSIRSEYIKWSPRLLKYHYENELNAIASGLFSQVEGLSNKDLKRVLVHWCELANAEENSTPKEVAAQ